ncbi:hypothetical protein [Paraburkholderia acidisoli]|nr:hypothetical protein [Paraburkholderia acidisoli]QGZ66299.1 hypothetical protein FAZ98_31385 [Paraburkholderia acidisoli]
MAANASQIAALREQGKQPAAWVLVSFIGRIANEDNGFTVYARPDRDYDWRWTVGLDLIAFARRGQAVAASLKAIRNERPKSLSLWDVDRKSGAGVYFDYPADIAELCKRARGRTMNIELMPWFSWQEREF